MCHPELCRTPHDTAPFLFTRPIFRPCGERPWSDWVLAPSERQVRAVRIKPQPCSHKKGCHPTFCITAVAILLDGPAENGPVMMAQWKTRRHVHPPPSAMMRNPGRGLDYTPDRPPDGPVYTFPPNVETPDHVKKVVSQDAHLQPRLVGFEPMATGLVPPHNPDFDRPRN